jgi:YHS domain-containing protein
MTLGNGGAFHLKEVRKMATDPVCKMNVDENKAAAKYDYKGKTYHFCAVGCKEAFAKDPETFLKKAAK